MKNISLKQFTPFLVAVVLFIVISIGYSSPDLFQGKTLYQNDTDMGTAVGKELTDYHNKTGESPYWTNGLFGGMPSYQISPYYPSLEVISRVQSLTWLHLPAPASYIFILLFGAFLLFIALRVNPWLAILGAIAYAFSSYFFIIIHAGHIWKVWVLAYIPATFAGIIWLYRGKFLVGTLVTALYAALQLLSNHPQMSYYFGMVVLIFVIAEFIHNYQQKTLPKFVSATALLILAGGIALSINSTSLYHSYDYSKYTIRGQSELSGDTGNKTTGGIDRDYATQWSYGIGETFTLLVPNAKGGATGALGANNSAMQTASNDMRANVANVNHYWGNQPFTSGPVYVGAFIMFLFILGLFIVEHRIKWVMLAATGLSILLSWGHNFMWFTDLFFDYFPLYNKFRAVASILVIAELCIPILALLTLQKIITDPKVLTDKIKAVYISLGATAGLLIVFMVLPTLFFDFLSKDEMAQFGEILKNPQQSDLYSRFIGDIEAVRISIFRTDAFRSLTIIVIGVVLMFLYSRKTINKIAFIVLVTGLVLVDLVTVDKRYLNSNDFKPKQEMGSRIKKTPIDEEILKDTSLDYRVFNLSSSPFQDGYTSFYHKSIGGYHAAKLRRYQDVIEGYLSRINARNVEAVMQTPYFNVPNMLNTKYIISLSEDNQLKLIPNPGALGNAWFVDKVLWANNADEEFAALESLNPRKEAVVDKQFNDMLKDYTPEKYITPVDEENISGNDSRILDPSSITLVGYEANHLTYKVNALTPKLAVFAEIYYAKGWHAYIDGVEVSYFRANYILRGMLVPQGEHTVEFRFDPDSIHVTESVANVGYILLLLLAIAAIALPFIRKKEINT